MKDQDLFFYMERLLYCLTGAFFHPMQTACHCGILTESSHESSRSCVSWDKPCRIWSSPSKEL